MQEDNCPIHGENHKYFIYKVVDYFEPVVVDSIYKLSPTVTYYKKVEYAIMGCNCGSVVREKIKQGLN